MKPRRQAFTLTELLVVMGLIGTLMSLLLPAVGKARAAGRATACLSNLRQMGTAWTLYTSENRGRLLPYVWSTPATPDVSWNGYWPGALDVYAVRGELVLCPAAREPTDIAAGKGLGNVNHAWSGKYVGNGTGIKLSPALYREGSYGHNRYTSAGWFTADGRAMRITDLHGLSEIPLFMDCAYPDLKVENGTEAVPVSSPPDLRGSGITLTSPEHWNVLLARHRRGINVCMADSSVRYVPLDELYMLSWKADWTKYRLTLPSN